MEKESDCSDDIHFYKQDTEMTFPLKWFQKSITADIFIKFSKRNEVLLFR